MSFVPYWNIFTLMWYSEINSNSIETKEAVNAKLVM